MSHVKKYLICYDVRNAKRLRRVHRILRDVALPVQFSVFEAELRGVELSALLERLAASIDAAQDQVSCYSLTAGHQKLSLGRADALPLL